MFGEPSCPASFSPSLPSSYLSLPGVETAEGGGGGGGGGLASPFPSRPSVVSSASAHSHTQAAAEASDIAPGAAKGIFSSDVNVFYFGMLNFNKG